MSRWPKLGPFVPNFGQGVVSNSHRARATQKIHCVENVETVEKNVETCRELLF